MRIELKGFNGHGWRVCDTCPLTDRPHDEGYGCYFGYEQIEGQMHLATGNVFPGEDRHRGVYSYVTIRPQECIDKHGK